MAVPLFLSCVPDVLRQHSRLAGRVNISGDTQRHLSDRARQRRSHTSMTALSVLMLDRVSPSSEVIAARPTERSMFAVRTCSLEWRPSRPRSREVSLSPSAGAAGKVGRPAAQSCSRGLPQGTRAPRPLFEVPACEWNFLRCPDFLPQ